MTRFLHLADLHIGKRIGEYSLLDDQRVVLEQALSIVQTEHCDEVLIAGDVYDKPQPPVEAMALFDDFLTRLADLNVPVSVISGNHDAAGRISYFSRLLEHRGITVPRPFDGKLQPVKSPDAPIQIWLLPFITPQRVRAVCPEDKLDTYEDAVRCVLDRSPIDKTKINILVAHQFITGGVTSDSEEFAVGGLDNVGAEVFRDFDYVALGHLHQPQRCGRDTVRYAGSPLKYSLSEEHQRKTFTIVEIADKAHIGIREIPIVLPHDVRTVRGSFAELSGAARTEDYVRVLVTDEELQPDARIMLRSNFPRMLKFGVDNSKVKLDLDVRAQEILPQQSPLDLFCEFFAQQNNGVQPNEQQLAIAAEIFAQLGEEAGR